MGNKFLAILRLVAFARNHGGWFKSPEAAAAIKVPPRYLEATFQQLVHAGVLISRQGPAGGFIVREVETPFDVAAIWRIYRPKRDILGSLAAHWSGVSVEDALAAFEREGRT